MRNADAFGVLFGLIGSLVAARPRADDGRLVAARAVHAARRGSTPSTGTVALLVISIGSTAFDGAKEGALFNDLAQDLQGFFRDLGLSLGPRARARRSSSGSPARSLIVGAIWTRSAWPG